MAGRRSIKNGSRFELRRSISKGGQSFVQDNKAERFQ
jgi:hypothetical protein